MEDELEWKGGHGKKLIRQDATDLEDENKADERAVIAGVRSSIKCKFPNKVTQAHMSTAEFFSKSLPEKSTEVFNPKKTKKHFNSKSLVLVREKSCSLIEVDKYLASFGDSETSTPLRPRTRQQIVLTRKNCTTKRCSPSSVTNVIVIMVIFFVFIISCLGFKSFKLHVNRNETLINLINGSSESFPLRNNFENVHKL